MLAGRKRYGLVSVFGVLLAWDWRRLPVASEDVGIGRSFCRVHDELELRGFFRRSGFDIGGHR